MPGGAAKDIGLGDTKRKIMDLLLDAPRTAAEVAGELKIQKSAARIHLESLQADDIVKSSFKSRRLGRPRKVYELTEFGRELFPRRYDLILNHVLEKIAKEEGKERAARIIESIADDMAADIRDKIEKSGGQGSLKESLAILNSESDKLGFASSLVVGAEDKAAGGQNDPESCSILSKNCILARVATENQEAICHGLHDRIIAKSLDNRHGVELKECMALGDAFCRHIITEKSTREADP
jgi:predicted ArsR family transcriptional regulator